jgi:hypothetical protein
MGIKLTKEEVNHRLRNKGYDVVLIGDYCGSNTKTLFRCGQNHEWMSNPNHVLHGRACPTCSGNLPQTKDTINNRIPRLGIMMVGEYIGSRTKSRFRCNQDHEWQAMPDSVVRGSGCPFCSNHIPLSKEIVNNRLLKNGTDAELIGEYLGSRIKTLFRCSKEHEWQAIPDNVCRGQGCPSCANHGFNPNKPASIYLIKFDTHIKYGISNNLNSRLKSHRKSGHYELVLAIQCDGHVALEWEKMIKNQFGGRFIDKTVMPDGWTETLSESLLRPVIDTMKKVGTTKNIG